MKRIKQELKKPSFLHYRSIIAWSLPILALIGITVFYISTQQSEKSTLENKTISTPTTENANTPTKTFSKTIFVDSKGNTKTISFRYPATWTLTEGYDTRQGTIEFSNKYDLQLSSGKVELILKYSFPDPGQSGIEQIENSDKTLTGANGIKIYRISEGGFDTITYSYASYTPNCGRVLYENEFCITTNFPLHTNLFIDVFEAEIDAFKNDPKTLTEAEEIIRTIELK